eukprot:COSAG01_NODE_17232_length_1167_cov_370.687266_2_plen_74_part_00
METMRECAPPVLSPSAAIAIAQEQRGTPVTRENFREVRAPSRCHWVAVPRDLHPWRPNSTAAQPHIDGPVVVV